MSAGGIRAGRAFVELGAHDAPLAQVLRRAQARLQTFGAQLAGIGGALLGAGGAGLAALAWPLKLAANMEQTKIAFEVMLGSADKAADMLGKLQTMAAKTPFETTQLADTAKLLLGFGVEAADILPTLQMLGDVASGDADKFGRLALAFGQASAKGRVMGGEVLQMTEAMFNPLKVLSEATGESMTALQKRMEAGKVSIDELRQAFQIATSQGGTFFQSMERQSATAIGKWSTLKDAITTAVMPIGEALIPLVNQLLDTVTPLLSKFGQWVSANRQLAVVAATGSVALVGVGAALVGVGGGLALSMSALGGFSTLLVQLGGIATAVASPLGMVAVAAAGAAALAVDWTKFGENAMATWGALKDAIASGDLELAFGVVTAGLNLQWVQATQGFMAVWRNALQFVSDSWATTTAGVMNFWDQAISWIFGTFDALVTFLRQLGASISQLFGTSRAEATATISTLQAAYNERAKLRGDAAGAANEERNRQRNEKILGNQAAADAATKAAQEKLDRAKAEFAAVQSEAKKAAEEAAKPSAKAEEVKQAAKAARTESAKFSSAGSFSASAARGLGATTIADRTAKATERTAVATETIAGKVTTGVAFS